MTESNTRTLVVLLSSFVAFVFLTQFANKFSVPAPATYKPPFTLAAGAPVSKTLNVFVPVALDKCSVSWVNGGNYALATPRACKGVSLVSMTIGVSAKSCAESTKADFRSVTNSTLYKGDFGFYLGQGASAHCLVVQEMWGKYI